MDKLFLKLLQEVSRPAVRLCLRRGLRFQELVDAMKRVFIAEASKELQRLDEKINVSRLSALSGLQRRDVMRCLEAEPEEVNAQGLIRRIIGQWQHDKRYSSKSSGPRALSCDGEQSEFYQMIRAMSKDLHPGTLLFELERLGLVVRDEKSVTLKTLVYVPKGKPEEAFQLLGNDLQDLELAVEENVFGSLEVPNLHASTEYTNIRAESADLLRRWILERGSQFHAELREKFSEYDLDLNPPQAGSKAGEDESLRVVVGTFSRIEEQKEP